MAAEQTTAELIQQYLDHSASLAERGELARRLDQADAIRAFVAAVRLDSWLRTCLQEERKTGEAAKVLQRVKVRSRVASLRRLAGAAAVLMFAGVLWFAVPKSPDTLRVAATRPTFLAGPGSGRQPAPPSTEDNSVETAVAIFGMVTVNALK